MGLPRWHSGKESACQCRRCKRPGFSLWVGKIPWSRKWQPTPWKIPWTEKPDGLQSMGLQRVRHDWMTIVFWEVGLSSNFYRQGDGGSERVTWPKLHSWHVPELLLCQSPEPSSYLHMLWPSSNLTPQHFKQDSSGFVLVYFSTSVPSFLPHKLKPYYLRFPEHSELSHDSSLFFTCCPYPPSELLMLQDPNQITWYEKSSLTPSPCPHSFGKVNYSFLYYLQDSFFFFLNFILFLNFT